MKENKWKRKVNIFRILESSSKYLVVDIRRRIEDKAAYLKKDCQYGLEEGFFGMCGVGRSGLGYGPQAVTCEQGHRVLYFIQGAKQEFGGESWGGGKTTCKSQA
jgi:hypothetical protein